MTKQRMLLAATAIALSMTGCKGDDDDDDSQGDGLTKVDAGHDDKDIRCSDDIPAFSAGPNGLEAIGEEGAISAHVVDADPNVPQRFRNDWTIELTTPDGEPLADGEVLAACAYMPVHLHGAAPMQVTAGTEPGQFDLKGLNLFMRGPWEVQLAVTSESVADGSAIGTACDPGLHGRDYLTFEVCIRDD